MITDFIKKLKTSPHLKKILPLDFFILLAAFLYGNIFAIQYSTLDWGFILIFGVVIILEIIDKLVYLVFNRNQQQKLGIHTKNNANFKNFNRNGFKLKLFFDFWKRDAIFSSKKLLTFGFRYFGIKNTSFSKYFIWLFFLLNLLKRGFLLGVFLEAFKVGS